MGSFFSFTESFTQTSLLVPIKSPLSVQEEHMHAGCPGCDHNCEDKGWRSETFPSLLGSSFIAPKFLTTGAPLSIERAWHTTLLEVWFTRSTNELLGRFKRVNEKCPRKVVYKKNSNFT
jgi:hypothetical protein